MNSENVSLVCRLEQSVEAWDIGSKYTETVSSIDCQTYFLERQKYNAANQILTLTPNCVCVGGGY